MLVCFDPGHGGKFSGAVSASGRYIEKDNTLAVARAIQEREKNLQGVDFIYTRLEDKHFAENLNVDIQARCDIANQAGADIFISIHQNAGANYEGYGVETFHYPGSREGEKLAEAIRLKIVMNTNLYNRGVKEASFYVLKYTNMPAALVEAGFVGGKPEEAEYVSQHETIQKIAEGILMGLADYLEIKYKKNFQHWDLQSEVDRLLVEGIINTPRRYDQPVTWGEFATILNRMRDGIIKLPPK